jgi:hypothetical protein
LTTYPKILCAGRETTHPHPRLNLPYAFGFVCSAELKGEFWIVEGEAQVNQVIDKSEFDVEAFFSGSLNDSQRQFEATSLNEFVEEEIIRRGLWLHAVFIHFPKDDPTVRG